MSDTAADRAVWIKTDPTPDGSGYIVTLEVGQDTARILTPDEAMAHAAGVLAAAHRAEYDAAVLAQLTKLGIDREGTVMVVRQLRADRPPLDPAVTYPLTLEPCVNGAGVPFITVASPGHEQGQWTTTDARSHAIAVLECVAVADLDAAYLRALTGLIGLDKNRARRAVEDLVNYRATAP